VHVTTTEVREEPAKRSWRKILCAVDFSDCSSEAIAIAADLARALGAELTLLHVEEPRPQPAPGADVERRLARCRLEAQAYTDPPIRTVVLEGSPAEEVVAYADRAGFDLVVTGTHGRAGVKRLVLGSVAAKVVAHAHCPVLVARCRADAPPDRAGGAADR
jgi:nucleotide-binding universal stress UspA family protein